MTKGGDMNWPVLAMLLMATLIWVVVARSVYRYDPPYTPKRLIDPELAGIRGWLILPAIGLTLAPLRVLLEQREMLHVFSSQNWAQTIGADGASPFLGLMVIVELIFNSGLIVIGITLAILFFQKRHTLPRLYVVYAVTAAVFIVSDLLLAPLVLSNLSQPSVTDQAEALKSIIGVIVWVWYFLVSKRVRATFTRSALARPHAPEFTPSTNLIDGTPQPLLGTDPKI